MNSIPDSSPVESAAPAATVVSEVPTAAATPGASASPSAAATSAAPNATPEPTTFAALGLSAPLLADLQALNFVTPTPIQAAAIPVALTGRDVIGIAQTGTGKTAAFCLPIIQRLPADGVLRALVLSPTRELTLQTYQCVQLMGKTKGFRAASVIGGEGFTEQNRALRSEPAMVVGTPGRVLDQIDRGNIDPRRIEVLVLDEADRLLDMGFAEQIEAIIRRLPVDRQTYVFTATMPMGIQAIARMYMRDPAEVSVGARMTVVASCKQELYTCTHREKTMLLKWLLHKEEGQVLVFTRTKRGADELERELRRGGHTIGVLHADRSQDERNSSMRRFREGEVQVLVATDLASRGLDIDGIARVVNFDVPPTAEDYLHRIGRTARVQREGIASTFGTIDDLSSLRSIEAVIKQRLPSVYVKRDDLLAFAREESAREHELLKERASHGEGDERPHRSHDSHGSHGRSSSGRPSHGSRDHARPSSSHAPRSHSSSSHSSSGHSSSGHSSSGQSPSVPSEGGGGDHRRRRRRRPSAGGGSDAPRSGG